MAKGMLKVIEVPLHYVLLIFHVLRLTVYCGELLVLWVYISKMCKELISLHGTSDSVLMF